MKKREGIYDLLRPHLMADDLIRRLGIEEVRRSGSEVSCRPLCHESASGSSLHVNLHTGRWLCRACQASGVRGDLVQLVEYVLTGGRAPSHGPAQSTSATHAEALRWLCQQFGIPFDDDRAAGTGDASLDVIHTVAMAAHEHLLRAPDVLAWIQDRWGFDLSTVESYGLGFLPSPLPPSLASESARSQSRDAFRASGVGWYDGVGRWRTRFEGRVLFPYLEHGRAIYLIGRATPWTPPFADGRKPPKYHKLSVHSEKRPYISARVTNDHLYNEPVMASASTVVVAEGVADAVALSALGVPVVSPVTISFSSADLERFARKARESNVARVEIVFDNELSGSGNWAARRAGEQLVERGIVAKVLSLPMGDAQLAARAEVARVLGAERFAELERIDPRERKALIAEAVKDDAERAWVIHQIELSKVDVAEWCAAAGAGAAVGFDAIRRAGRDVINMAIDEVAVDQDDDAVDRVGAFSETVQLAAHIEDATARAAYAGAIARAAGKGVTKVDVLRRISIARKEIVQERKADDERESIESRVPPSLVLLPPEEAHTQPAAPPAPNVNDDRPPAPLPPSARTYVSDHERYASVRDAVAASVDAKLPIEQVGKYVAQTITVSMGYTPFRTPDDMYLVRGSERIQTGLRRPLPRFESLLFLAAGLTPAKNTHRPYIASATYFLENGSRSAEDVSWSHVDKDRAVYFPTGDEAGRLLKIEAGSVTPMRMADVRVPAVAGEDFAAFRYQGGTSRGVEAALDVLRWVSISTGDRMILTYWLVCLPVLRRIGTVPIVRIEGGSGSGKTRVVEAISYLVNGRRGSSVPTAAALVSRMSTCMLTIDDNRETVDVSSDFLGTLLQATHLGAREKRRANTDTGTVIERVCGALVMNGIEAIHDGRPELTSRMLVLRSDQLLRAVDSPVSDEQLTKRLLGVRDAFWSEAAHRCAAALDLDGVYGEHLGAQIEKAFGATRIGRLSAYLRLMYLAWVAGLPAERRDQALASLDAVWLQAFRSLGRQALDSLVAEELAVTCVRYAFDFGEASAVSAPGSLAPAVADRSAFSGKFQLMSDGEAFLGPMRASELVRIVREAGKHLNAPAAITQRLRAGQLEQRILDGVEYLGAAGLGVTIEETSAGHKRFLFHRAGRNDQRPDWSAGKGAVSPPVGGETWQAP